MALAGGEPDPFSRAMVAMQDGLQDGLARLCELRLEEQRAHDREVKHLQEQLGQGCSTGHSCSIAQGSSTWRPASANTTISSLKACKEECNKEECEVEATHLEVACEVVPKTSFLPACPTAQKVAVQAVRPCIIVNATEKPAVKAKSPPEDEFAVTKVWTDYHSSQGGPAVTEYASYTSSRPAASQHDSKVQPSRSRPLSSKHSYVSALETFASWRVNRESDKDKTNESEKQEQAQAIIKELEKLQTPMQRRMRRMKSFNQRGFKRKPRAYDLESLLEHPFFDSVCAVVIIFNSVLVGYDVEWRATRDSSELWVEAMSYFCSIFFLCELIIRMCAGGWTFFCGESWLWSLFDTMLVIVSVVDFLMSERVGWFTTTTQNNVTSGLKTVKMLRIARVFRIFRFFKELSLLALMILDSMKSLMWALLMLSIILYVFAIIFTQSATDYIKSSQEDPFLEARASELERQFGSISTTVYTLLQAMLGGVSWGAVSDSLFHVHWVPAGLFFFYIFFTMLAFLNITTGVFVDNAVETAKTQRDFLVQKEIELREKYLAEMRHLFMEMDDDNSGTVSLDEVNAYFEDPRVQSYFAALGLEMGDTERLFTLLDTDRDGDISVDEFLEGCLRLKGFARSIDVHHLAMEVKKVNKTLTSRLERERVSSALSSRPLSSPRNTG